MKIFFVLLFLLTFIPAEAHEFRVLSWNVYMLPKPIKSSLQKTRTRIIPEELVKTNYDMIFMQEAFTQGLRSGVRKKLKATHPHTFYLKNRRFPTAVFGSGLYVLSRYPVKLLDHVYFSNCRSADCFAHKGAVLMEIILPQGQKVHVVNTHMQATDSGGRIRLKQLGQIHAMLARHSEPSVPQFLVGDLNIDPAHPEFELGLSLMGMDYARLAGPIRHTTGRVNSCYKVGGDQKWVDHMWFDNYHGISATHLRVRIFDFVRKGKSCPLSDHHAVEASFRF